MNNAVAHSMLVSQYVHIYELAENCPKNLQKSEAEWNFTPVWDKLLALVICKLHNGHTIGHFRVQKEMECRSTGQFHQPNREIVRYMRRVLTIFIYHHCINSTAEHEEDYDLDHEARVEHFALLFAGNLVFFSGGFQIAQHCQSREIFFRFQRLFEMVQLFGQRFLDLLVPLLHNSVARSWHEPIRSAIKSPLWRF